MSSRIIKSDPECQSRYADEGTLSYIAKLEQQLAACQADNLRLREALVETHEKLEAYIHPVVTTSSAATRALATPTGDMAALREVIESAFDEADNMFAYTETAFMKLRSGEWTPEALK